MLAFLAVVMPKPWIGAAHDFAGLGDFPSAPVAGYLARSASALYALHGLMVVYMSFDVRRYWPLIRFLGQLSVLHGAVILGIDLTEEMPRWWIALEGPTFMATGLLVLWAQHLCERDATSS